MSEFSRSASVEPIGESDPAVACADPTRRALLTALAGCACLAAIEPAAADDDEKPGASERPQKSDVLVRAEGDKAGEIIKADDLTLGGPPIRAWPKDPKTSVVRNGSRLNEVVLVKLDPSQCDDATRTRAPDGIVCYSVVCTHAGCPITAWVKQEQGDNNVLKCMCHNSEYDPRQNAQVVFGPAPRRLAALPLTVADGAITVAAAFVGKVGAQPGG